MTDSSVYLPANYNTFQPPAAGGSYVDSTLGATVKRMSNAPITRNEAMGSGVLQFVSNEYSSMTPFNSDNSRILALHFSYFGLYDGNGDFIKDLPFPVNSSSEPRWSRTNPNILYFVNGNQLKQIDVSSNTISVVHTFAEYSTISGKGESDISSDGNHFAFAGDNRYIFLYEISTDTRGLIFDTGGVSFDSLYVTPDNNVTITWYGVGSDRFKGIEMFDRNMRFLRQVARAAGHMDVSRDVNGDEVLLWANAADPTPVCSNGVVKIRLADAAQTCLLSLDWNLSLHISGTDNSGWLTMETYAPSDPAPGSAGWKRYTNEILQVKLDGTAVRRIAHHRSRPLNSYQYQPRASSSRDGTRLTFTSNYGLQSILGASAGYGTEYSDIYLIVIGSSTTTPLPPSATAPSPTPVPDPTISGPTTVRYEEDSASNALTGSWLPNGLSLHSANRATLSMTAGSMASFSFTGTGVSWIAYRDEWSGIARVYLDGTLVATVDTYATPSKAQAVAYAASGLVDGSHTLAIEATGTKSGVSGGSWVWIDAFDVVPVVVAAASVPTTSTSRAEQTSSEVTLQGVWSTNNLSVHSSGSAVLSMDSGARAVFAFSGTSVSWIGYQDEWSGIAKVYIDGALRATVDSYASPAKAQQAVYSIDGLTEGNHTLIVEATGTHGPASGGSWVWVDAFDAISAPVSNPAPTVSLPTAPPPAPPAQTLFEQNDPAVKYTGTWSPNGLSVHSGGSAVSSMQSSSDTTLVFNGTGVTWIAYRDQWSGIARVFIDGVLFKVVNTYSSTAKPQSPVFTVSGLQPGIHQIRVRVTGTRSRYSRGNWVWVDAFKVKP